MPELAFLAAMRGVLAAPPLTPPVAGNRIGATEPVVGGDLPCVVLSLDSTTRRRAGLGDRSDLMTGALRVVTSIDLASPLLPGDPTFSLVDATRRIVVLPHGGLVRSDGAEPAGPLGPQDIVVRLDTVPVTVVTGAPAAAQVQADPLVGQLTFGTALPGAGALEIEYFVGQWERRVERIAGVLRVDACAATGASAEQLGAATVSRLLTPTIPPGAVAPPMMSLTALSSVEHQPAPPPPGSVGVAHFRRRSSFAFEYQHIADRVDSSGGVIRRIPLVARLEASRLDRLTGTIITEIVVDTA